MEKEFVPYEQALTLKELGFDEDCLLLIQHSGDSDYFTREPYRSNAWLNGEEIDFKYDFPEYGKNREKVKISTFSQAFRWFREKYNYSSIFFAIKGTKNLSFDIFDSNYFKTLYMSTTNYLIYEEAELACLKKLIEIAQKQK